ncbi:hypothetical protein HKBW3S44_01569, partial [Candidatus Hakubella thermalkaliphila]
MEVKFLKRATQDQGKPGEDHLSGFSRRQTRPFTQLSHSSCKV